jgi:hypothetical protein
MTSRQLEMLSIGTFCAVMLFSLVGYRAYQSIEPQPRPITAAEVCR